MPSKISFSSPQKVVISDLLGALEENQDLDIWGCEIAEPVRRAIKAHSIKSQKHLCCYCKEKVCSNNFKMWEVEHVLPRNGYSQFTFEPLNLAISCPDCNNAKSDRSITISRAKKRVPARSDLYLIVHPHLDRYEDHIVKVGLLFQPKSTKGRKTIEICGLLRYAANFVDWESLEEIERFECEARRLQDRAVDPQRIKKIIAQLMELL